MAGHVVARDDWGDRPLKRSSGVACPLKDGSALTRAGWEFRFFGFWVFGFRLKGGLRVQCPRSVRRARFERAASP